MNKFFAISSGFIVKAITFIFTLKKMNKRCLCPHEFNDHVRGPIKEMKLSSRFTLEPAENRLNCKIVIVKNILLNVLGQINFGIDRNDMHQKSE